MSKSRGNVVDPWDDDRASTAPTRCGSTCSRRARCGCPSGSTGARSRRWPAASSTRSGTATASSRCYAGDWTPAGAPAAAARPLVDRWLLSRLDATVDERAARPGPGTTPPTGVRALMEFVVDDLSQLVRARQPGALLGAGRRRPIRRRVATLHEALVTVSRLLAPAAPFASDWLHRALTGTSVHLARFPEAGGRRDPALEAAMDAVRRLASLARARAARTGSSASGSRSPGMQVAVPAAVRRARARRAARAAAARGEREGGRGGRLGRRAGAAPGQAQLPLARASATASGRRPSPRRRRGSPRSSSAGSSRASAATLEVDGEAATLPARGRGGRARGGQRLAGGERRAVRRGASIRT